jgi:hypothetical protein
MGGWDAMYHHAAGGAESYLFRMLVKWKWPGTDLPDTSIPQAVEEEVMTVEDYDFIINKGWSAFLQRLACRLHPELSPEALVAARQQVIRMMKIRGEKWTARGVATLLGGIVLEPLSRISMWRTLPEFSFDLYRYPEKLRAVAEVSVPDLIHQARQTVEATGVRRVLLGAGRVSSTFISPRHFEYFVFPSLKALVEGLVANDIEPVFHFDTNWTLFLPYFKEFPRGRCVLELDGTTDIFRAKEILANHICLMGDVPASLLAFGTPEEVTHYTRKLIEVVGEGGGFILSSGCEVPFNARPENVRAMLDAAREYGYYR